MILDYLPLIIILAAVGVFIYLLIRRMPEGQKQAQILESKKARSKVSAAAPTLSNAASTSPAPTPAKIAAGFWPVLKKIFATIGKIIYKAARLFGKGIAALASLINKRIQKSSQARKEKPEQTIPERKPPKHPFPVKSQKEDRREEPQPTKDEEGDFEIVTETSLSKKGRRLLMNGKLKDAETAFIKLVTMNPQNLDAYQGLGEVYLRLHNYADAGESFKVLIKLGKKTDAVYGNLALALYNQRKYEEAVSTYRKSLKLDPTAAFRHANLGRSLVALEQEEEAAGAFQKAIEHDPKNIDYLTLLAQTAKNLRDFSLAKNTYERIIALDPDNEKARQELADLEKLL